MDDKEILENYLQGEPYAKAILAAIEQFGFDERFQTVYIDAEKRKKDTEADSIFQLEKKAEDETSDEAVTETSDKSAEEQEVIKGVYLWFYKNLLLYSKDNQVDVDFLEQMLFMSAPDCVAGRKDNVNIVSWLLTDYQFGQAEMIPKITDANGKLAECFASGEAYAGEWGYLKK